MDFVKNAEGIIINNDDSYYRSLLVQRSSQNESLMLNNKVTELTEELKEMREMLKQISNRIING